MLTLYIDLPLSEHRQSSNAYVYKVLSSVYLNQLKYTCHIYKRKIQLAFTLRHLHSV